MFQWRKSSFCASGDCAEMVVSRWRKSSFCGEDDCAEVAITDDVILLRNSTNPGVSVSFTREEWNALAAGFKAGEFD